MKKINLLIVCVALLVTSCATVKDNIGLVSTASELAMGAITRYIVKDQAKRVELSNWVYFAGSVLRSLSGGETNPTPEKVKESLQSQLPNYEHWQSIAASLSSIYAGFYNSLNGDIKTGIDVLNEIANGADRVALQLLQG